MVLQTPVRMGQSCYSLVTLAAGRGWEKERIISFKINFNKENAAHLVRSFSLALIIDLQNTDLFHRDIEFI